MKKEYEILKSDWSSDVCSSELIKGPFLAYLELDHVRYDESELEFLGKYLSKSNILRSFSSANCMFGDSGAKEVGEALAEFCNLEYLNLSHNKITSNGVASFIRKIPKNSIRRLKSLDLSENLIDVNYIKS